MYMKIFRISKSLYHRSKCMYNDSQLLYITQIDYIFVFVLIVALSIADELPLSIDLLMLTE